jgi:hypothetical protein
MRQLKGQAGNVDPGSVVRKRIAGSGERKVVPKRQLHSRVAEVDFKALKPGCENSQGEQRRGHTAYSSAMLVLANKRSR